MNTVVLNDVFPKSIYGNNPEVVNSISIVLQENKQNYLLSLNETQALSIDTSQLSSKKDIYQMTFNLEIVANGHYAINFAGCNIEQIEFYKGVSQLKFTKAPGDLNWEIKIIRYAGVTPEVSLLDWNLRGEFCLATETGSTYYTPIFRWFTDYNGINTGNIAKYYNDSTIDYYTFSMNPFTLTEFSIHYGSYDSRYQSSLTIYGSNDFETWIEIYNNPTISVEGQTTPHFTPHTIRAFKHFKFHLSNGGTGGMIFEPMTLKGIGAELLYAGYMLRFPPISAALNGYDVAINTEDGCAMADNKTPYGAVNGNYISVTRPNQSTVWKVTFTYPTAVRPCCFFMQKWGSYYDVFPAWFAWYGSDDGINWEKVIELRNILPVDSSQNNYLTYYPCDFGISRKYWQFRCYATYSNPDKMSLANLIPITPYYQYSQFESIVPKLSADEQEGYTVSASSTTDGAAYKMYDQDSSTYCGGSIADGAWTTTIDMGEAVIIQGIQMRTTSYTDRMPTAFKVQGSNDGTEWTDISTQTPGNAFWSQLTNSPTVGSFEFENNTAYQYYRLYVTATAQGTYVRICDLGWTTKIRGNPIDYFTEEYSVPVMGSNSQDGYVASADSEYSGGYPAWHAFDRNIGDTWSSVSGNASSQRWIQIANTNENGTISGNAIYLTFTGYYAKDFKIQGSDDGSTWTDITEKSGNTSQTVTITLSETFSYKYWRLFSTLNNGNYCEISQFNIVERTYYNNN